MVKYYPQQKVCTEIAPKMKKKKYSGNTRQINMKEQILNGTAWFFLRCVRCLIKTFSCLAQQKNSRMPGENDNL